MSAVIGAAIGGEFTNIMVRYIGSRNLLLASAGFVFLAYFAFLGVAVARQAGVALAEAKGAEEEETFSLKELGGSITRYRHLQVIMAIIVLTYIVDVTVEYQFNAMAKLAYPNQRDLTAFLGRFYGRYLNLITFVFQFFLTTFVVNTFGVGGALQIMPVSIAAASVGTYFVPGILTTGITRLTESATRYTFNRTGMELLYLPLPLEFEIAQKRSPISSWTGSPADRRRHLAGFHQFLNLPLRSCRWRLSRTLSSGSFSRSARRTNTSRLCANDWRRGGWISTACV